VDPYYLTQTAEVLCYQPQVILAGRRITSVGKFIAEQTIKQLIAAGSRVRSAIVNVLGLTFKGTAGIPGTRRSSSPIGRCSSFERGSRSKACQGGVFVDVKAAFDALELREAAISYGAF